MNALIKYFSDFKVLKETKKEFWGVQIINMLDCIAYFGIYNVIYLTLGEDFGYSDIHVGYIFTIFTMTTTIFLLVSGLITDWLGIKKAMYVALLGCILTRGGVVFAAYMNPSLSRTVFLIASLFFMGIFNAMIQTIFQAATRRFTTKRSRSAGFNLWYLFMNIGALGGGLILDILYIGAGLPRFHVFTFSAAVGVITVLINFFFIKNTQQLYGEGEAEDEETDDIEKNTASPFQIAKEVLSQRIFWKFIVLTGMLLGVRMVFLYLGSLHTVFWTRVIGPDVNVGALQAFNPFMVIIGLIVFIPLLDKFKVYNMLVFGALITSVSMFIIAIPPLQGYDVARWTYGTTIVFLVILTVGELIWSPRLQEYTAAIAPKGQEGSYLGLSMFPYYLAKAMISISSGHLLTRWCPKPPEDNPLWLQEKIASGELAFVDSPYMMWTVLAGIALAGTIGALLLKKWFTSGTKLE